MTPDPLSEKYYSISPYAFCNNNPVSFVDPDGRFPDIIWDIASIGVGVHSFVQNVKSGNIRGAVGDGFGIAVDVVAAAVPFLPGGIGAVRAGAKTIDAAKAAASVSDGKVYVTYTKVNPKTGEVYSGRASGYGTPKEVVPQEMQLMESVRLIQTDKDMKMQEEKSSVNNKKTIRQRRVVGAVMEINIDDEYYVYAQSYPHTQEVVFDYRSSEPLEDLSVLLSAKQLFRTSVYRRVIGSGYWKKVGKLPLREDLLPVQMEYIYHKFGNIQFEIYNPATGKVTPATKEECRGLERAAVWDYGAIAERIRDYYNGVPCVWLNEEYELFKD